MKRIALFLSLAACLLGGAHAQEGKENPVLLAVGDDSVTLSDFLKSYAQNLPQDKQGVLNREDLEDYLQMYIDFRLKVKAAEDAGADTMRLLQSELQEYRMQLARPYLMDTAMMQELIDEACSDMHAVANFRQIVVPLDRYARPADTLAAYNKCMEIRKQLLDGADFSELAWEYSADYADYKATGRQWPEMELVGMSGYITAFEREYAIEKQVAFLASHNDYGLVVGNNEFIDGEGNRCYWDENCNNVYNEEYAKYKTAVDVLGKMNPYFNNEKFGSYETLYMNNYIPNGYLVRRELYNIILPFSKEAPLEDWFFMLQLSKYCKFKYIDQVLFSYRWHDNNTIKKSVKIQDYREATREYEEKVLEMLQDELPPKFKQILDIGVLSKKWGVPYIFEIFTYNKIKEKRLVKTKILKIFNVKIGKYVKSKLLQ